jgi:hypothetical protein
MTAYPFVTYYITDISCNVLTFQNSCVVSWSCVISELSCHFYFTLCIRRGRDSEFGKYNNSVFGCSVFGPRVGNRKRKVYIRPWRCRRHVPAKRLFTFSGLPRHYIPEDRTLHNHSCENLSSYKITFVTSAVLCTGWVLSEVPFIPHAWISVAGPAGRSIAHAVSRRLPTAASRVRARVLSCGNCGGQSGTGAGFLRVLRFPLPFFIPPVAPQSPSSSSGAGTVGQ